MALVTRVVWDKEGNSNSNKGDGNKGGGQARATRAMETMWAVATAMRLVDDEEGKGKDSKGDGDGDVRVVGNKEGKGSKAMVLATRMAGELIVMAMKKHQSGAVPNPTSSLIGFND
jgi:hypothetical protein